MSKSTFMSTAKSFPQLVQMLLSLSWMYLTLGIKVGKARRAFEKQLIQQGMSRDDARRLSASFEQLKNDITGTIKQTIVARR